MPLGFFSSLPWNVPAAPCDYHRVSPGRLGDTKKGIEKQQEQPGNIIRKEARRQSTEFNPLLHPHQKSGGQQPGKCLAWNETGKVTEKPLSSSCYKQAPFITSCRLPSLPLPSLAFPSLHLFGNVPKSENSSGIPPFASALRLFSSLDWKKRWWRLKGTSGISSSSEIPLVTTMHVRPWKRFSSNRGRGRRKTRTPLVSRSYWTKLNSHCLLVPPHTQLVFLRNERVSDWDTSSRQAWGGSRAAHIVHRPLNVQWLSRKL